MSERHRLDLIHLFDTGTIHKMNKTEIFDTAIIDLLAKSNHVPAPLSFEDALVALDRAHRAESIDYADAIKHIERERIIAILLTLGVFNVVALRELLNK